MTRPVMGVRKFRETFPNLTEPTEVIRATKGMERLGVWIPNDQRTLITSYVHSGSNYNAVGWDTSNTTSTSGDGSALPTEGTSTDLSRD